MAASFGLSPCLGAQKSSFSGARIVARPPCISRQRVAQPLVQPVQASAVGYGKDWKKLPLNKNGKVIRHKMHVKVGDYVVVIAGSDKGKQGEVDRVDTKFGFIWMKDVNMKTRYSKPVREDETGTMNQKESPFHHSNVMHFSKEQKVRSRVGKKVVDGKKVRYLKKTGEILS